MEKHKLFFEKLISPVGILSIYASDIGVKTIKRNELEDAQLDKPNEFTTQAKNEIVEYFEGTRKSFQVNIDISVYTPFQKEVWAELMKLDFGEVVSYKDLAIKCGDKNKVRAVGRANGANPIPIIIPCHRVIGADGSLVGFSQGIDMKQYLLEHEQAPIQLTFF